MHEQNFSHYLEGVTSQLVTLANPDLVFQAQKDKHSNLEFLAITIPMIRQVIRAELTFYKFHPEQILDIWTYIWQSSPYFEVMTAAAMYYELKRDSISPSVWPILSTWSNRVENWAHADQLAKSYSFLLVKLPQCVYNQLQIWNWSSNPWHRRLSLVSLIHYTGKNSVFMPPDKVLPLVANCVCDQHYFVQTAVGWVLREMGRVYPDEVGEFIEKHLKKLSTVSFTRAIKYLDEEQRGMIKQQRSSKL